MSASPRMYHTASGLGVGRVLIADHHASQAMIDRAAMSHAAFHASRSTCPQAAVGAVILRRGFSAANGMIYGWNGSPDGVPTCREAGCVLIPATETSREYSRHLHAEARAIGHAAKAGRSIDGATIYVTLAPCLDCARLIGVAGISRVVIPQDTSDEWAATIGAYLHQAGVAVDFVNEWGTE